MLTAKEWDILRCVKLTLCFVAILLDLREMSNNYIFRDLKTKVLDSDSNEQCFDRYTTLATTRLFNVPISHISLIDIDRQWFKSRVCLTTEETYRDHTFCSYAVLEDSPDVFVVLNAEVDDRFKNNSLVTGYPFIRFYAGALLIVDNTKVGTLYIIDTKAHNDFSLKDKMNLMDLKKQHSPMMLGFSRNLRTPLMCLAMGIQNLRDDVNKVMEKHPDLTESINHIYFKPVNRAIGQLTFLVESSLETTELMSLSNNNVNEDFDRDTDNILPQLLEKAMSLSSSLNRECKIKKLVNSLLVPDAESADAITLVTKSNGNNCNIEVQLHAKGEFFHENEMELRRAMMSAVEVEEEKNGIDDNDIEDGQKQQQQQQPQPSQVNIDINIDNIDRNEQVPWKVLFRPQKALKDIRSHKFLQTTSHSGTFSFSVPCEIRQRQKNSSSDSSKFEIRRLSNISSETGISIGSPRSVSKMIRVLVVEDSIPIQKVMKSFLKGIGCDVSITMK
eukprot:gene8732-18048_t